MSVRRTRNDRDFWYCLLDPDVQHAVIDENGHETGEIVPHYEEAKAYWANVSPATGQAQAEQFGGLDSYDRVIVTRDRDCPIDENAVLFLDGEPAYTEVHTHVIVEGQALYADDEIEEVVYQIPQYDYIVKRVAKGLNGVSIAVRKVEVG